MTKPTRDQELTRLRRLLDAFGADPARWPAGAARRLDPLIAGDGEARQLMAEAAALDRLLDSAGAAERADEAPPLLVERIMRGLPANVTSPTARRSGEVVPLPARRVPVAATSMTRDGWRVAALLAASLVAGLYVGAQSGSTPLAIDVADRLGVETLVEPGTLALGETAFANEEDVL